MRCPMGAGNEDVDAETQALKTRLRSRWEGAAGEATATRVATALRARQPWAQYVASLSDVDEVMNGPDLRGSDLSRAQLAGANLQSANFAGARLMLANLERANLSEANLAGALLT